MYDTQSLYVEREGAETRITDKAGKATYTFTKHRVRKPKGYDQGKDQAQTTADTDTIKIQTVHGLIIITDKTANTTYYIE